MSQKKRNVWFITGTSTGLGRAFAEYAIKQEYQVVVTARNMTAIQDLVEKNPMNVLGLVLDVNNNEDVEVAVRATVNRFGGIDVLINNAGYALVGACEETTDQLLRDQFNTNFFGAISVTRAVLPYFRVQSSGSIVQISSIVGSVSMAGFGAYSASKFALEGFSEALQAEVAPFGIKVLIVKPGMFRTDITSGKNPVTPSIGVYDDQPAGHMKGDPGDEKSGFNAVHGTQLGDPARAAVAIDTSLRAEHTPLRLLLGSDCVAKVAPHLQQQCSEYNEWDALSRSTDYSFTV